MFNLRHAVILFVVCGLSVSSSAQEPTTVPSKILKPFPAPAAVIADAKKFNAVEFGPGNSFVVRQTPKDFELEDIALSDKGELLAIV